MANKKISDGTVHKLTADLQQTLYTNKTALATWESLTPLARNEWICWVIFVKQESTRKKHIARLVKELKEGKRRPCCWLGCIHRKDKEISPSVKSILGKKVKIK